MPTLKELFTIPADAVEYNVANLAQAANAQQFHDWMDEVYPNGNIKVSRANLAFQTEDGWNGFMVNPFGFKGAYLATVITLTVPDMYAKDQVTKVPNPYHNSDENILNKVTHCRVMGGNWRYAAAVNNARIRVFQQNDGPIFLNGNVLPPVAQDNNGEYQLETFVPHARMWGQRADDAAIVTHKGNVYAELRPLQWYSNTFFSNGIEIDEEMIKPFLKKNNKESQAEHQGVNEENMVHLRDYKIEAIKIVKFARRTIWVY